MPIKPSMKVRYPKEWNKIRKDKLEKAGNKCEGSPSFPNCRAENGKTHPDTGSKTVLQVCHWPDHRPENVSPENIWCWCYRCHNAMDHLHRSKTARLTQTKRKNMMQLSEIEKSVKDIIAKCEELDRKNSTDPEVQEAMEVLMFRVSKFEKMDTEIKNISMEMVHGNALILNEKEKIHMLEDKEIAIDGKI